MADTPRDVLDYTSKPAERANNSDREKIETRADDAERLAELPLPSI